MGILIKGTDMPKEGEFSCFRIYPDGRVTVELDGEEFIVAFASEVPDGRGNCTGENCIMQHDKVDPKTCRSVSFCPQATPYIAVTQEDLDAVRKWLHQHQQ